MANICFAEKNPHLISEYDESNEYDLEEIRYSSAKKALWNCKTCGWQWRQSFNNRSNGKGCPRCVKGVTRVIIVGENDLGTLRPDVLSWWDDDSSVTEYSARSGKKVWWKCKKGHRFSKPIKTFNFYCKICTAGNSTFKEENSFAKRASQELLSEWHTSNIYSPEQLTYNSARVITWECKKGHIWDAPVYSRYNGTGCGKCTVSSSTSIGEQELADFIETHVPHTIRNTRSILSNRYELDIYCPDLKIAFEYNGNYWHSEEQGKGRTYHYDKWKECKDLGIQLISIWETQWYQGKASTKRLIGDFINSDNSKIDRLFDKSIKFKYLVKNEAVGYLSESPINPLLDEDYLAINYQGNDIYVLSYVISKDKLIIQNISSFNGYLFRRLVNYLRERFSTCDIYCFDSNFFNKSKFYEENGFQFERNVDPGYFYLSGKDGSFTNRVEIEKNDKRVKSKNVAWDAGGALYKLPTSITSVDG